MGMTIIDRVMASKGGIRSPARTNLAKAIYDAQDAEAAKIAAREAIGRGHRQIDECEERVAQSAEAVKAARSAQASRMAASAATAGAILAADRGLRDARDRERDAIDELDAAKEALIELEANADKAEKRAIEAKTNGIKHAAATVVAEAAIDPTIARASALASEIETRLVSLNQECGKIRFFLDKCFNKWGSSETEQFREMQAILNNARQFADQKIRGPVYQEWAASHSSLETDPDAPLP